MNLLEFVINVNKLQIALHCSNKKAFS